MRAILVVLAIFLCCSPSAAALPGTPEGNEADATAIAKLGQDWQDAWNRRDADGLAAIMDPQLVFVSVQGPDTPGLGRGGREAFKAGHAAILKTMFANSNWTTEDVTVVRWLRPDIAVAHVLWRTTGDRVRHVKYDTPRRGLFTWVLEKRQGQWRVVASQNTEAMAAWPGQ